jgi:hypothetical protein
LLADCEVRVTDKLLAYLLVLAAYLPSTLLLMRRNVRREYPLIAFSMLGMFIFNACGSIFVIFPGLVEREDWFSWNYIGLLVLQSAIFHMVCGAYLAMTARRFVNRSSWPQPQACDEWMLLATLGLSLAIVAHYLKYVGAPPLWEIVQGHVESSGVIALRNESFTNLSNSYLYNLGMVVMPCLAASQALVLFQQGRLARSKTTGIIVGCTVIVLLPGHKGTSMLLLEAVGITWLLLRAGEECRSRKRVQHRTGARGAVLLAGLGFAVLMLVSSMYSFYYGDSPQAHALAKIYRIIGVYSEAIAASVPFTEKYGMLDGMTLPNIRGLLSHTPMQLDGEMHFFLFGGPGGAPVPSVGEGYINFGWTGALAFAILGNSVLVLYEEIFRRAPRNLCTFTVLSLYCYFAVLVSQVSLFSSLISLTYTAAIAIVLIIWRTLQESMRFLHQARRAASLRGSVKIK